MKFCEFVNSLSRESEAIELVRISLLDFINLIPIPCTAKEGREGRGIRRAEGRLALTALDTFTEGRRKSNSHTKRFAV
jgi:hypothetical protein